MSPLCLVQKHLHVWLCITFYRIAVFPAFIREALPFLFSMQYRVIMLSATRAHCGCVCLWVCVCVCVWHGEAVHRLAELMNHLCRSKGNPSLLSMQPCLLSASATASADIKRLCWLTLRPAPCAPECIHTHTQTLGVVFQHCGQIRCVGNISQLQRAAREKTKVKNRI